MNVFTFLDYLGSMKEPYEHCFVQWCTFILPPGMALIGGLFLGSMAEKKQV